jgi:hypothetical protein
LAFLSFFKIKKLFCTNQFTRKVRRAEITTSHADNRKGGSKKLAGINGGSVIFIGGSRIAVVPWQNKMFKMIKKPERNEAGWAY